MSEIQVFIASYNRAKYLKEAINSVLDQTAASIIELIISDNSTNNDVQEMMAKDYSSIKYVRRTPSLPSADHFKAIISDVTSDFYMIFHDDDVMHPQLLECLYNELTINSNLVAASANGWYYYPQKNIIQIIYFSLYNKQKFDNPFAFINKYLIGLGVAPFSGYMYKSSVYRKSFICSEDGGKYGDVSFLLKGLDYGSILWLNKPLMYYRIHDNNDSGQISFDDREKIIKYFIEKIKIRERSLLIKLYRMHDYNVIIKHYIACRVNNGDVKKAIYYFLKNIHVFVLLNIPILLYKYLIRLLSKKDNYKLNHTKITNVINVV